LNQSINRKSPKFINECKDKPAVKVKK